MKFKSTIYFIITILIFSSVYGGWHSANQVVPGPFATGDYSFDGTLTSVNFECTTCIDEGDIAQNQIDDSEIEDNSLTASSLGVGSVGTSEVADNTLTASDLAANSVGSSEIATGGVIETDILQNTLDDSEIQDNSLTAASLAANSVGSSEIATGGVIESDILQNTLDDSEIQDNSLTASSLAANSCGDSEMIDSPTFSTIYTSNWFRSTGNSGWYSQTYGGGWYMIDTTWIRNYGGKKVYLNNVLSVAGNLGVGTTAPAYKLEVVADSSTGFITRFRNTNAANTAKGIIIQLGILSPINWNNYISFDDGAGTQQGAIAGNGGSGVIYWSASDRRLKENITRYDLEEAVDKIMKIDPVRWVWKNTTNVTGIGYIAQDLKKVFPKAVFGEENKTKIEIDDDGQEKEIIDYMMVSHEQIVPLIHAGLKSNIIKTDSNNQRLIELENENKQLKQILCDEFPDKEICQN